MSAKKIENFKDQFIKSFEEELGDKAKRYVESEFNYDNMVELWHDSLNSLVENWQKERPKMWALEEIK